MPTIAQQTLVNTVGSSSGKTIREEQHTDKLAAQHIAYFKGKYTEAPLIEGCVAWLECRLIPEEHNQQTYDLFIGEVVAAWADSRVFKDGHWDFSEHPELRTLHHVAGGFYFTVDSVSNE